MILAMYMALKVLQLDTEQPLLADESRDALDCQYDQNIRSTKMELDCHT